MAGDASNMISNWAGGGATVTLGAAQYLIGRHNDKKNKRPDYNIPPEIAANLSDAELSAMEGMPAEQKEAYLSNIQRGTAFGLSQMGSRKAGLTGLATLNEQQNGAYMDLLAADSAQRLMNKQNLYQARQISADYKDKEWQFDKQNPYYENKQKDQAMMGAGMQNMSQGFQSSNSGYDWGGGNQGGKSQYGTPGQEGNMYNYNPYSNRQGVVDDGNQFQSQYSYTG